MKMWLGAICVTAVLLNVQAQTIDEVQTLDKVPDEVPMGVQGLASRGRPVAALKEDAMVNVLGDMKSEKTASLNAPGSLNTSGRSTAHKMRRAEIPGYVIKYAPVVHLYSEERYMPYDIAQYTQHFALETGYRQRLENDRLNITDLQYYPGDENLFMVALDEFDDDADWITGKYNQPDIETGKISNAPATLIVLDRGNGQVDAYWFYFYSFNEGPYIMGTGPYGNHIGDWEHSLVRFIDGEPQTVWMSAHGGGNAYKYSAMEKLNADNNRPVIFSARGTHANYASVGQHSHDLPFYILSDFTDRGPLWDPAQNYLAYAIFGGDDEIAYANGSVPGREKSEYGNWLTFAGHWGDQRLNTKDPRQRWHPFEWKYIDGPTGPMTKNLNRYQVCQRSKWWNLMQSCRIRSMVDFGEGVEAEGGNCARTLNGIKPLLLQYFFRLITWRGWGCFFIDRIWG